LTLTLLDEFTREHGAFITGDAEPELLADVDPKRNAKTRPRLVAEKVLRRRARGTSRGRPSATNAGWAETVFGDRTSSGFGTPSRSLPASTRLFNRSRLAKAGRKLATRTAMLDERAFDVIASAAPAPISRSASSPRPTGSRPGPHRHGDGRHHAHRRDLHDARSPARVVRRRCRSSSTGRSCATAMRFEGGRITG
jgi:hypothetical protein